jgi:hypothetical protein
MEIVNHIRIISGEVRLNGICRFSQPDKELKSFVRSLYKHLGISYTKFYKMSPLSQLGFLASEMILAGQNLANVDPEKVSLVIANSSSSLHTDRIYQESVETTPSPAIFVYTLPNIVIGEICIRNGFKGEGVFFIQESYDKGFIFEQAEALINSGRSVLCLAGWLEVDLEGDYLADLSLLKR